MAELRFDGRVALITGAGRGLGREYALLLASRGAKVVVNDVGAALNGEGVDAGPAEQVVQAIRAAGGEAIASTDSVATPAGGQAIVDAALDHYGRIDIVISNAGNLRYASMKEISHADFAAGPGRASLGRVQRGAAGIPPHVQGRLRPHRPDFIDQRVVREPARCRELRRRQDEHDRIVQCPGARRRRGGCEVQHHRARFGHAHGWRRGSDKLSGHHGARDGRARGGLAVPRDLFDDG